MRIVVTGDWHLNRSTSGYNRFDDVSRAIDETVRRAIEVRACMYLFLGDLTDPRSVRSYRAIEKAIQVGSLLRDEGIDSLWLAGNHDVVEDGSGDSVLLPLRAADLTVLDRAGLYGCAPELNLVALPFTPSSHSYDPAAVVGESAQRLNAGWPTIVAGHLCIEGAEPGSETEDMPRGRDVFWPVEEIRQFVPGAVMVGGHYHRRQVAAGVNVVGSLERLTHGEENNEPGFLVLEV